jgi:molybdate transport system substrate-binding protein
MKKNLVFLFICVCLISMITAGCSGKSEKAPDQAAQTVELNVSAAVSLKDALTEIQKQYEVKNPNVKILYNLGASGSLQKQIEQGAPADLFISAAPKQMDELDAKNLINKVTRKNLVENELVLVIPVNSTLDINQFNDLVKPTVGKVSIGEPSVVPAGQYAQEVLRKLNIWDKVSGKAVLAKDVRTVLTYVETGNVEAGIVYKTDAASSTKVKIAAIAPEGTHQPIVYPAAVLTSGKQQKAAEDFFAYLMNPESKAIFEKYGFTMGK